MPKRLGGFTLALLSLVLSCGMARAWLPSDPPPVPPPPGGGPSVGPGNTDPPPGGDGDCHTTPEPTSLLLASVGAGLVGIRMLRRRHRTAA
jgi:hypothetical protein